MKSVIWPTKEVIIANQICVINCDAQYIMSVL